MKNSTLQKFLSVYFLIMLIGWGSSYAQEKIRGQVTEKSTGNPLPGVNVLVKGSGEGTVTDLDGNYSLLVPGSDAVLVFSYIGFLPVEQVVGSRGTIDISLEPDIRALNEVVVVGYGTQIKRNVTGSVAQVDVEQLESQPNTNIGQALRGRVPGVQFIDNGRPGQSGEILVRGQRSITANNDPLIVVDGAFFNGELADINPNDVESMEVLKDASAAAIYGSRAANGVILITTKKGTSEKPTFRFNTYYGFSDWSYRMPLHSPESYLQRRLDFRAQNQPDEAPVPARELLEEPEQEMFDAGRTVDPWEAISQKARQQSYNLSISGSTERTNYFISGSYVDEDGLIYGDRASRTSLRLNLTNKITDWLEIGINSQYTQRDLSGVNASTLNAYWLSPYSKLYFDDAQTEPIPFPSGDDLVQNPMFNALLMDNEEIYNNLFANLFAIVDVPFVEGLTYTLRYNPNLRWNRNYSFSPIYEGGGISNPGRGRKFNRNQWDWQVENIVSYKKEFDKHSFDLTLLYGRNYGFTESTFVEGRGFVNDENGWNNLDIAETKEIETAAAEISGVSSMARLNYQFMQRYLLTLTARRDGSSVFGADRKYGTFPSVALGWIISDEPFMQDLNSIDMLKLRLSYGAVGNQAVPAYRSLERSASAPYVFGSETYFAIFPDSEIMANPTLGWETTVAKNVAMDFEFFSGRLGGTVEYYDMNTTDLLLGRGLAPMTGFRSTVVNLGETSNKGVEIALNTLNVRSDKFQWKSEITFASNRNRIEHLYFADADNDGQEDNDLGNRWFIGQPIGVTYDYVFDGIYQEGDELPDGYQAGWVRVKDLDNNGEITPEDRTILGQRQPKYRWGINNIIRYGGLSLNFFINSMQGWESEFNLLDVSSQTGNSFPGRSVNFLDAGYWTPENRSNTRPGLTYTNPLGMNYYLSRDFIRLQDVTLAYDFPAPMLERIKMNSLRVYLSGRNLVTITDWMGPDPESGYNTINNLYPTSRTIVGGLTLSF